MPPLTGYALESNTISGMDHASFQISLLTQAKDSLHPNCSTFFFPPEFNNFSPLWQIHSCAVPPQSARNQLRAPRLVPSPMSTEQILKLQPDRTLYLRGFDGTGAAASLCEANSSGFTVYGVFRDMADFCVLVLHDADNIFEHYSVRYLPDTDLSGLVLSFDLTYNSLQPIDSPKYSWIDWAQLDVITADSQTRQVRLWDHATLASGTYSVAQGTFTLTTDDGGCYIYDRLTLFINNAEFNFIATGDGTETAAYVAKWFARQINCYAWAQFFTNSVAVIASADESGTLTLKYARTGFANISGTSVQLTDLMPDGTTPVTSNRFPGIAPGAVMYINPTSPDGQDPVAYTVASVESATSLTLTTAPGDQSFVPYLVEYGGSDGNNLTVYMTVRPDNINLHVDKAVLPLTGGSSDVTWHVSLNFSALGIDQVRQAWITFAPALSNGAPYTDTEWTARFTNWSVADPLNKRTLQIAGPGSVRIGNADTSCTYLGNGWNIQAANNYWRGFSRVTHHTGDSFAVSYTASQTHDVYLGTSLYLDRRTVAVTLDGDSPTTLDCYLDVMSELVTRRLLRTAVPPGDHTVTFTVGDPNPAAKASAGAFAFIFDYLEAAVPTAEVTDALVVYDNVSPALDFDTDATYKMSPQRLLWHVLKLGFRGQLNEYIGVFWWNQRKRFGGVWNSATIDFSQVTWHDGDTASISIGGFTLTKSVITWDSADTIARHFVYYINSATVAMWAEPTGRGQIAIHTRTPLWGDTIAAHRNSNESISVSGTLDKGKEGEWQVDPAAADPINFPVRQWHADLFREVKAAGLLITTSFSMELVNPPDDGSPENAWQARYYDGVPVTTDTGFASLLSSQCSFIENMTEFQKSAFTQMAGLQSAAGLTPWLQFGEFLWWFFSEIALGVFSLSATDSAIFEMGRQTKEDGWVVAPHNMATGDRVVVSGVRGCPAVNGTWSITVLDDTHFSIPVMPDGVWDGASGQVRGGSMAYYDAVTKAAAEAALGRPLYKFTCQDDDPTVNGGADAAFLVGRLKTHIDAIRTAVLAQYAGAKFEILYPNDVNNPVCLLGPGVQYPQGGRLNAAVNLPPEYLTKEASGLDRFKVEALSWGATYLHMDLAHQAIVFALTSPMSWDKADVAYLIPWFNGTCPWPREFGLASSRGLQLINFWAYDHLSLMSWPLPLPTWFERSFHEA